jgi:hypothetical protein
VRLSADRQQEDLPESGAEGRGIQNLHSTFGGTSADCGSRIFGIDERATNDIRRELRDKFLGRVNPFHEEHTASIALSNRAQAQRTILDAISRSLKQTSKERRGSLARAHTLSRGGSG